MHEFSRAAVTKYPKLGGLNNGNLLSHGPGGQVLAGFVPSDGCEGESVPCLSPSFWWFAGNLRHRSPISPCLHLHMVVSVYVQISPVYKDTGNIGLGSTLMSSS